MAEPAPQNRKQITPLSLYPPTYFTLKEAAEYLRISPSLLWQEKKAGNVKAFYIRTKILFRRESLDRYTALLEAAQAA